MLSCSCTSQPREFNPLNNSFLEIETKAVKLKKQSSLYVAAYTISSIALSIIAISIVFYVGATCPIWTIVLAGTLEIIAIKLIFEYFLNNLNKKATEKTEAYLYEKSIIDLTKEIQTKAKESSNENFFYEEAAKKIGCQPKDPTLASFIALSYKESAPDKSAHHLAPILARAEKCHEVALARLKEIDLTLFSVPEGSTQNPYQEELQKLNEQSNYPEQTIKNVRKRVRSFDAIVAIKWKEFLEIRMSEIFTAYVYQHPVHSGKIDQVGHFSEGVTLIDYLLENSADTRNTLFAFKPHFKEFTRTNFEAKQKEAFKAALYAGTLAARNLPSPLKLSIDEDASAKMVEASTAITERNDLANLINEFAQEHSIQETTTLDEFEEAINRHYLKLFCDPRIQKAIRPIVNAHYIQLFKACDLSSIRGRLAKGILSESKLDLTGDLSPLKGNLETLKLKKTTFSTDQKETCTRIFRGIEHPTIWRLLSNREFQALIDELEVDYYKP